MDEMMDDTQVVDEMPDITHEPTDETTLPSFNTGEDEQIATTTTTTTEQQQQQTAEQPKKQSSARARAEARRKRILAGSKNRLSIVSGEQLKPSTTIAEDDANATTTETTDESTTAPVVDATDAADTTESTTPSTTTTTAESIADDVVLPNEGDATAVPSPETPEKPAKLSGSARLKQMRSRRFKKQQSEKAKAAAAEETTTTDAAKTTTTTNEESETTTTTTAATTTDADKTVTTTTAESIPSQKEEEEPQQQQPQAAAPDDDATGEKKYMGVARMRRKMLAEKKKKDQSQRQPSSPLPSDETKKRKSLKTKTAMVDKTPVLFQLLTVLLLFLCGLDVGLKNAAFANGTETEIRWGLSVGEALMNPASVWGGGETTMEARELLMGEVEPSLDGDDAGDEFTTVPEGATEGERVPNIDPIFRLDLDEFTKHPGLLFGAARVAVKIHRVISYIFILYPLSLIRGFVSLPQSLLRLKCPPVLFLLTTILRQVGTAMGAGIPQEIEDQQDASDILEVASRAIKNFFVGSFPKLVGVYGVVRHAREDIYVVLCGLFLGLALPLILRGEVRYTDEL